MSEPRDEFERRFSQRYAEYLRDAPGTDTRSVMAALAQNGPRSAGWLRMTILGAATVAAAAVITLVVVGVLPNVTGPVGDVSGSPQPSVAPSATPGPTATPAASATPASTSSATPPQPVAVPWPTLAPSEASVPTSLDGQDFAFWTSYYPPPCCTSLLRISTSAGSSDRVIEIPGIPSFGDWPEPAGPAAGRVVYVVSDGRTRHLRVADARTGADRELTSTSLVIGRVAIDPSGSTAYYMLFDRLTRDFQGLWAIPTSGGQPTQLVSVPATTGMATLVATRVYEQPQLAVSDDGSRIAYVLCYTTYCEFHAIHADGTADPIDWSNFHTPDVIVGIAGDLLIGASECPYLTCDGFVLDLRTGERWPLGGDDAPFSPTALIVGPHGPLVLGERLDYDQGRLRVDALDLTDGSRSTAFEATFEPGVDEVHLAEGGSVLDFFAGADLPAGWFLIARLGTVNVGVLSPPDYSAAMAGAALATDLPFMDSPTR